MAALYLIVLQEESDDAWAAVQRIYAGRHHLASDTMAFVAPEGITTTGEIGNAIGLTKDPERPSGLVVRMFRNHLWGILPTDSVDWLREAWMPEDDE